MKQISEQLNSYRAQVAAWLHECFGETIANDKLERNHRFFEESTELVQSCGMTQEEAHMLVDYVYNRPIGEPFQEVGGVMTTLAALCYAQDIELGSATITEYERIYAMIDKIRQKQKTKPPGSPLAETPTLSKQKRESTIYAIAEAYNNGTIRPIETDVVIEVLTKQNFSDANLLALTKMPNFILRQNIAPLYDAYMREMQKPSTPKTA